MNGAAASSDCRGILAFYRGVQTSMAIILMQSRLAPAVLLLCARAGRYITGADIPDDGATQL